MNSITERIYQSYIDRYGLSWLRPHLGASQLGLPCPRALWLHLHHAMIPKSSMDGRILRLFQSGNVQEPRILEDLKNIGVTILDTQTHFVEPDCPIISGSCDGIAVGFPEYPDEPVLLEFKTSNTKGFKKIVETGIKLEKPVHYIQMNVYMHWANLKVGLYVVVCKETDEIYTEWVNYEKEVAILALDRAKAIVRSNQIPPKIVGKHGSSENTKECMFCDYKELCYHNSIPVVNCRTCLHCECVNDKFECARYSEDFDDMCIQTVCEHHVFNPYILNWDIADIDVENEHIIWKSPYGGIYDSSLLQSSDFEQKYQKEKEAYLDVIQLH